MLQTKTVEPRTLSLLKELMALPLLSEFNLVGGTALSLYYGHRMSVNLDLFTNNKFDTKILEHDLINYFGNRFFSEAGANSWGIFCYIDNVKVDLVHYPHKQLFPIKIIDDIRIVDEKDIIAMEIQAILGRGKKKDFWDLAELLKTFTILDFVKFHQLKFPNQHLLISIPQTLLYFDEASEGEDPISLNNQTWQGVQLSIQQKVEEYLR
jgi:hypothetical protein